MGGSDGFLLVSVDRGRGGKNLEIAVLGYSKYILPSARRGGSPRETICGAVPGDPAGGQAARRLSHQRGSAPAARLRSAGTRPDQSSSSAHLACR